MIQISEQLFDKLAIRLKAWQEELNTRPENEKVTMYEIDLAAVIPDLLALAPRIRPPVTHSYPDDYSPLRHAKQAAQPLEADARRERELLGWSPPTTPLESEPFAFNPAKPGPLTRLAPLPEQEPGYGSQRTPPEPSPHLLTCPARYGGSCNCPVAAGSH